MKHRKKRIAASKKPNQAPVISTKRKRKGKGSVEAGLEEAFQETTQSGFLLGALVAVPLTLVALKGIRVWKARREEALLRDLEREFEAYEDGAPEDFLGESEETEEAEEAEESPEEETQPI